MQINLQEKEIISFFYFLTPLFVILDYFFGLNIRIAGLEHFGFYKYFYYLFCIICAVIIHKFKGYSLIVGFIESSINLLILFIGFLLPYYSYASLIEEGNVDEISFYNSSMIINFMVSGFILIITFQYSLNRIRGQV